MATNFAQALFRGMDDSNQRRLQEQSMQRQNRLADLAVSREERADQTDQRGQLAQLARGWKSLTDSTQRKGYYDRFIQPAVSQMGFGDLGPYDEAAVDGVASQILAAYGGQAGGDQFTLAPGSKRFATDGSVIAEVPFAPQRPQLFTDAYGNVSWLTPPGASSAPAPYIDPKLPPAVQDAIRRYESTGEEIPAQIDLGAGASGVTTVPGVRGKAFGDLTPAEEERLRIAREAEARAQRAEQRQIEASAVTGKPPTEDERKAAGWFNQATFALQNMEAALKEDKKAAFPGVLETYSPVEEVRNRSRSPARQKYAQAASSFAEAALRAATGAGINEFEAQQKIRELTPQRGDSDEVQTQKLNAMKMYVESLRARAGRAMPGGQSASPPRERRARNPQTGEVLVLRNGQWVKE
jgi:hypothetical protein